MPPKRRTRRKRKGSAATRIMKQRLGLTSHGGSRPYMPWSRTLTTVTLGEGHNPGTLMGASFVLPVNNWNDPLGTLSNLVSGTGSLTHKRHPVHHDDAIVDGYDTCQVLSWKANISVNWIKADDPISDYMVAYTIVPNKASAVANAVGDAGRIERLEIMTNPRWTVKHFKSVQGITEVRPRNESVSINIPNVYQYCKILAAGADINEPFTNGSVSHTIADVSDIASDFPRVLCMCTVVIMTESGLVMAIDSLHITVHVTQKVKLFRAFFGIEDMLEGEADLHP